MRRSTERILTTHTGSLPRPEELTKAMFAKEEGVPVDGAALAARIKAAVAEVVGKQVDAGIDVVDDGEYSKPSYATYVKDRLHGFLGKSEPLQYRDLVDFPGMARRVFGDPGRARRKTPACTAPVSLRDPEAARADVANLQAAPARARAREAFLTAASPGVISLFFKNEHYPTHEAYLFAIAEAMRHEYETVARAGFVLQIDCPDLGMGRHIQFADLDIAGFRKMAQLHIKALDHALSGVPPEQIRMHVCWGNYEGPHHFDVPLADIIDLVLAGASHRGLLRGSQPPSRARVARVRDREGARGQDHHPGRDRFDDELHRASRPGGRADHALREAGWPGERHRGNRLRVRDLGGAGGGRSRHRVGQARRPRRGRPLASKELW